jgi:hypothetical protein
MSEVLKGKFWFGLIPVTLSWFLIIFITGVLLHFSLWQVIFLLGITIWGLVGASAATVAIGGLTVDFKVEEIKQRISIAMSYFIMGLNTLFVLMTIAACVWLMTHLFANSPAVQMIQVLADYDAIGWLFSDSLLIPIALLIGQVVFWISVKVLWDAAVLRLEKWEES